MPSPTPSLTAETVDTTKIELPTGIPLTETADLEDAKKADLPLANATLQIVHLCWGEVKSIAGVEKLIKMTIDATKHRRAVLGIPYGIEGKSESGKTVVLPLD